MGNQASCYGKQPTTAVEVTACCTTVKSAAAVTDYGDIATEQNDGNLFTAWEPEPAEIANAKPQPVLRNFAPANAEPAETTRSSRKYKETQDLYNEISGKYKAVEGKYNVFSWLQWHPEPGTACHRALHAEFPGAVPGPALHHRITSILGGEECGFKPETTLLGTSLCPDEINNEDGNLIHCMKGHWGHVFPLGGISGAPFVGATGFTAFSHHVPDNGDIILVYGPHVGVSSEGEIGKCLRSGQGHLSTACGAVIGAYKACSAKGATDEDDEFDENDMQMAWIKRQLAPHVEAIQAADNPMALLAYQAYEMVNAKLEKIVNNEFGSGRLVLIGGIQINMPAPFYHHFLPLRFEIRQKGREPLDMYKKMFTPMAQTSKAEDFYKEAALQYKVFSWLHWAPELDSPCLQALHAEFPGAVPGPALHYRIKNVLGGTKYGFKPESTLLGTSLCPDEINNEVGDLIDCMKSHWGHHVFPLGGISGAPFAGATGFNAFAHHVPENGDIIVVYGPHVAISNEGEIGKCLREGQAHLSTACGAVIGAYKACSAKGAKDEDGEFDENDMQMAFIKAQLAPHVERIKAAKNPMASLAYQAYEMVNAKMDRIVNNDFGGGRLVLIGGIQINMPAPFCSQFLPRRFEVRQKGQRSLDWVSTLALQKNANVHPNDEVMMGA